MRSTRFSLAIALACLGGFPSAHQAAESVEPAPSNDHAGTPGPTDNLRSIPQNAYEDRPDAGLPVRTLFRDTRPPYLDSLRDLKLEPSFKPSDNVGITTSLDLPDFRGRFPLLQRGFEPENADLKLGPIFFKLRHISSAVLVSDNVNHSEIDRKADVLAIASIGGQIMAQLSEGLHIAASGSLVFLPTKGESGISGFALRAPFAFGVTSTPVAEAQVAWEPVFFGLPFIIADEMRIGVARFSDGIDDGVALFDGSDFDAFDRSGVYTLRGPRYVTGDDFRHSSERRDLEFVYYSNELSAATGGPLLEDSYFRFRASHEDIWYQTDQRSNFPTLRDRVTLSVESQRESLRFKPYLRYEGFHRDNPERFDHMFHLGVRGPITDLLYLRAELGYLWQMERSTGNALWRFGLYHTPNSRTQHSLEYTRETSDFHDELDEQVVYRITATLGPSLTSTAYSGYHWIEDLDDTVPDRTEWRNGLRLSYFYSPKTTFRFTTEYVRFDDHGNFGSSDLWRGRVELTHRFYEHFMGRVIYQFQQRDSNRLDRSYAENLLYMSVSWLFD